MAFFQSPSLWVRETADGSAELQFEPPGDVVRLDLAMLDQFDEALTRIEREGRFRRFVIRSLRARSFCQGPDAATWRTLDLDRWAERGQALFTRLRKLPMPSLAWVDGACLGPGLELALACRRLVVVDRAATVLGYSEVDVGLVPSWGSVGSLLARTGLELAFPLVLAGRRLTASEATAIGLADRVVPRDTPIVDDIETPTRAPRTWRRFVFESSRWGRRLLYRGIQRVQKKRLAEELPGPAVAFDLLRMFAESGDDAGRAAARKGIVALGKSTAFENLLRFHELRDRAVPEKSTARHTVGIVGATPLGMHLTLESVRGGDSVVLRETDEARLGLAILSLMKTLNSEIKAGRLDSTTTKKMLAAIRSTSSWKNFDEVDLAVDTRAKGDGLDLAMAAPNAAMLVTTSLGGRLDEARRFGIRVAEPFGSSAAVELRHGPAARAETIRTIRDWLGSFGWVPIVVADRPGLLLTRMWLAAWNEALLLMREGARPERIEQALSRFGFGPHFLRDLDRIGIDRIAGMVRLLAPEMERIPFDPFWQEMVERRWSGESAGKGFYRYGRGRPRVNEFLVNALRAEGGQVLSHAERHRAIRDRIVLLMVNEAFRALEERAIGSEDDLDLAMMMTDWAPHRGGPLRFAERAGLETIVAGLRRLETLGPRYVPAASLLARAGTAIRE
jgi:3-hydroxyacyl-CoA dehydrogenase / enoyl-CoA hydratase / 3-hydroxybutyryl-CoA epimerase